MNPNPYSASDFSAEEFADAIRASSEAMRRAQARAGAPDVDTRTQKKVALGELPKPSRFKTDLLDGARHFIPIFSNGETNGTVRSRGGLEHAMMQQTRRWETYPGDSGVMTIIPKRRLVTGGSFKLNLSPC